jgi:hypothetical protein
MQDLPPNFDKRKKEDGDYLEAAGRTARFRSGEVRTG